MISIRLLVAVLLSIILLFSITDIVADSSNSIITDTITTADTVTTSLPKSIKPSDGKILVLGSSGLIGRSLVEWLESNNYTVLHVHNRTHIDLRLNNSLSIYQNENISFCYFLACEVGGSQYIDNNNSNIQLNIIQSNLLIYNTVFAFIQSKSLPFIFTSSYLQSQSTSYGSIKRLGENWIKALNINNNSSIGRIVRLWNIYGSESAHSRLINKSHVLTDWINNCIEYRHINSITDGTEVRQFLSASDTATALGLIMEYYQLLDDSIIDLTSNQWNSLREISTIIQSIDSQYYSQSSQCTIQFSTKLATVRDRIEPNLTSKFYLLNLWKPKISLLSGINTMYQYYYQQYINNNNNNNNIDNTHSIEITSDYGHSNSAAVAAESILSAAKTACSSCDTDKSNNNQCTH